jgi:DNA polymerase-3 subunit gamma/tau
VADSEGIEAEVEALHIIAQKADGALRDALSIFDQIVSFAGRKISYNAVIENLNVLDYDYYFRIASYVYSSDISSSLLLLNEIIEKGFDGHQFINGFGEHLRNLLVCKDQATVRLLEVAESTRKRYLEQSRDISLPFLIKALDINNKADLAYKSVSNKRLQIELSLLQMASLFNAAEPLVPSTSPRPQSTKPAPVAAPVQPAVDALKPMASASISTPSAPAASNTEVNEPVSPLNQAPSAPESPPKDIVTPQKQPFSADEMGNLMNRMPSLSIKDAGSKVNEPPQSVEDYVENPGDKPIVLPLQQEIINDAVKKYSDKISETHTSFSTCLKSYEPKVLDNNIVELSIDNSTFEDRMLLRGLLEFLKQELGNSQIWLKTNLVKPVETFVRLTRPEDKFKQMAEKNPELENFAKQLNLDLDV